MANNQEADELQYQIQLGEALKRLESNPDFIEVISKSYMTGTLLVASRDLISTDEAVRKQAIERMTAITHLRYELSIIANKADNARADLAEGRS